MEVRILSTPGCAECAAVKRTRERIRGDYAELELEEIDVAEHPEVAAQYSLMSAPGIVIDGKLEFTGHVSERELRQKLDQVAGPRR